MVSVEPLAAEHIVDLAADLYERHPFFDDVFERPNWTDGCLKPGRVWSLSDSSGAIGGLRKASLKINGRGEARFSLKTVKMPLLNADLADHFIETTLEAGTYKAQHSRLWSAKGTRLKP